MKRPSNVTAFPPTRFRFSPRWILIAVAAVFLLIGGLSSFFTVSPESVAVVQRFGKYQYTANPGLHFKLP